MSDLYPEPGGSAQDTAKPTTTARAASAAASTARGKASTTGRSSSSSSTRAGSKSSFGSVVRGGISAVSSLFGGTKRSGDDSSPKPASPKGKRSGTKSARPRTTGISNTSVQRRPRPDPMRPLETTASQTSAHYSDISSTEGASSEQLVNTTEPDQTEEQGIDQPASEPDHTSPEQEQSAGHDMNQQISEPDRTNDEPEQTEEQEMEPPLSEPDHTSAGSEQREEQDMAQPISEPDQTSAEPEHLEEHDIDQPVSGLEHTSTETERMEEQDMEQPISEPDNTSTEPEQLEQHDMDQPVSELEHTSNEPEQTEEQDMAQPMSEPDHTSTEPEQMEEHGMDRPVSEPDHASTEPEKIEKQDMTRPMSEPDHTSAEPEQLQEHNMDQPLSESNHASTKPEQTEEPNMDPPVSEPDHTSAGSEQREGQDMDQPTPQHDPSSDAAQPGDRGQVPPPQGSQSQERRNSDQADAGGETDPSLASDDVERTREDNLVSHHDSARSEPSSDSNETGTPEEQTGFALSPKASKKVSFDHNSPSTLLFTPDETDHTRQSDGEARVSSDDDETQDDSDHAEDMSSTHTQNGTQQNDAFQQLLALIQDRTTAPSGGTADQRQGSIDPNSHLAKFLRDLEHRRNTRDADTSDVSDDEENITNQDHHNTVTVSAAGRRSTFSDTIEEFLGYLQAIAEDHKAHQEAMHLLDETDDASATDTASEAASDGGDSAWSEADSQPSGDTYPRSSDADSASELGSIGTDIDSGLATSPRLPLSPTELEHEPLSDKTTLQASQHEDPSKSHLPGLDHDQDVDESRAAEPSTGNRDKTQDSSVEDQVTTENIQHSGASPGEDDIPSGTETFQENDGLDVGGHGTDDSQDAQKELSSEKKGINTVEQTSSSETILAANDEHTKVPEENKMTSKDSDNHTNDLSEHDEPIFSKSKSREDTQTLNDKSDPSVTSERKPEAEEASDLEATPEAESARDQSRVSSADRHALRDMLASSLTGPPAVEVAASQSDAVLQSRRNSRAADDSLLLVPATDSTARSPGQVGSLELVSKSPGELSQEASQVPSASELHSQQEPVQSLASIADVLLREGSDDEVAAAISGVNAVESGVGASNSLAAISGQLLTDRTPPEPGDNAPETDEAVTEKVINTIDIQEADARQSDDRHETVSEPAETSSADQSVTGSKGEDRGPPSQEAEIVAKRIRPNSIDAGVGESGIGDIRKPPAKADKEDTGAGIDDDDLFSKSGYITDDASEQDFPTIGVQTSSLLEYGEYPEPGSPTESDHGTSQIDTTNANDLETDYKLQTQNSGIIAGTRKPEEIEAEEMLKMEYEADGNDDRTGDAKSTASDSSVLSDLRSDLSEYATGSERDPKDIHDHQVTDDIDGKPININIDENPNTLSDNFLPAATNSAKKLAWSLIAMASGIVGRSSVSVAKIASRGSAAFQERSIQQKAKDEKENATNNKGDEISRKEQISDTLHEEINKELKDNISIDKLKERYAEEVQNIIQKAQSEVIIQAKNLIDGMMKTSKLELMEKIKHEEDQSSNKNEGIEKESFGSQDENVSSSNVSLSLDAKSKPIVTVDSSSKSQSNAIITPTSSTLLNNLENSNWSTEELHTNAPSPGDIASVAVAITKSILNSATKIADDAELVVRRSRIKKSISHFKQGEKPEGKSAMSDSEEDADLAQDDQISADNSQDVGDLTVSPSSVEPDTPADAGEEAELSSDVADGSELPPDETDADKTQEDPDSSLPADGAIESPSSDKSEGAEDHDEDEGHPATESVVGEDQDNDLPSGGAEDTDNQLDEGQAIESPATDGQDGEDAPTDMSNEVAADAVVLEGEDTVPQETTDASAENQDDAPDAPQTDDIATTVPQETTDASAENQDDAPDAPQMDEIATEETQDTSQADTNMDTAELSKSDNEDSPGLSDETEISSSNDESVDAVDEGLDTADGNRIRYELGEIADQTQNVVSMDPITSEMLNSEPDENAVQVGTDVAGETPPEIEGTGDEVDKSEEIDMEPETDDVENQADMAEENPPQTDGIEDAIGTTEDEADEADSMEEETFDDLDDPLASNVDTSADAKALESDATPSEITNKLTVSMINDLYSDDSPEEKVVSDEDTPSMERIMPPVELMRASSHQAADIVAPDVLEKKASGASDTSIDLFVRDTAQSLRGKESPFDVDKVTSPKESTDIIDEFIGNEEDDTEETSEDTSTSTTTSTSSGSSQETIKADEDTNNVEADSGKGDNVFDWLRRVSTQMDEMGITEQLKEKYGETPQKDIVMDNPREPIDTPDVSPSTKLAFSDTGMYHDNSLSMDDAFRLRQSGTQTECGSEEWLNPPPASRAQRPGAARPRLPAGKTPCGCCPCCLAMKHVVSGGKPPKESVGDEPGSDRKKDKQRRKWTTSPARSVGDLLDDGSSATATSVASSDNPDAYQQRMRNPKKWLKAATDEFMRRECIRQVVLKNDTVSDGCTRTKVTRISRHPNSLTDCLASCGKSGRIPPGQSLQMEISRGETMVDGKPVNYQDVKIRTPRSCQDAMSVKSVPSRRRSSRCRSQASNGDLLKGDSAKEFIDTYLAGSQSGKGSRSRKGCSRDSKCRKKITITTDCRKT